MTLLDTDQPVSAATAAAAATTTTTTTTGNGRLQGKVAIVTGASSGIGRAIALRYAAEGAFVVCSDLQPESNLTSTDHDGKATHEAINALYPTTISAEKDHQQKERAIFVKADVTSAAEQENLVKQCVAKFGRLDIMVNNAGIANHGLRPMQFRLHEVPEHAFDTVIAVNLKGVYLGCKYAIAQMLSQPPHSSGDRGWVINTASILGFRGMASQSEYSASKGAVVNLTRTAALEYGKDRIHVNALAPGFTKTAIISPFTKAATDDNPALKARLNLLVQKHPFGPRLGDVDDIAGAAVFLASADAQWVTGHTLAVDGGYLAG